MRRNSSGSCSRMTSATRRASSSRRKATGSRQSRCSPEPAREGLATELGWSKGDLNGVIRMAITGRKVGPPLYESLEVLGKEKSLRRIEKGQDLLAGGGD